jgi:RNA polymerase sigma-B factor
VLSSWRYDIDDEVEDLAIVFTRAEHPAQRAELLERIVRLGLPLADATARRYAGRGVETDDLIQVARTALVVSIHRYQPGTGPGFAAFAAPTISGELKRYFRDHGWSVRPPRRVQELRSRLVLEEERLRRVLARHPREDELAAALGVSVHDVAEVRLCSAGYRAASLDAVAPSGTCLADHVLVAPCPTDALDLLDALRWAVARLSTRQQLILRLRFVEELSQAEIGDEIGVSQMQVSRLLHDILHQLRRDIDSDAAVPRERRNLVRAGDTRRSA